MIQIHIHLTRIVSFAGGGGSGMTVWRQKTIYFLFLGCSWRAKNRKNQKK